MAGPEFSSRNPTENSKDMRQNALDRWGHEALANLEIWLQDHQANDLIVRDVPLDIWAFNAIFIADIVDTRPLPPIGIAAKELPEGKEVQLYLPNPLLPTITTAKSNRFSQKIGNEFTEETEADKESRKLYHIYEVDGTVTPLGYPELSLSFLPINGNEFEQAVMAKCEEEQADFLGIYADDLATDLKAGLGEEHAEWWLNLQSPLFETRASDALGTIEDRTIRGMIHRDRTNQWSS
jgi:hypothetical protein